MKSARGIIMPYDPFNHHRRSIRLKGYDYTQPGAYFVTMVTKYRECLFGNVSDSTMITNENGSIVQSMWCELPGRFPDIELDEFKVMPNHIHGIIYISETVGARSPRPEPSWVGNPLTESSGPPRPVSLGAGKTNPMSLWAGKTLSESSHPSRPGSTGTAKTTPIISRAGKPRPYVANTPPDIDSIRPPTLGQIIAYFKYQTTKQINRIRGTPGAPVWQRNYHDHIIRNMDELARIREYIRNNPLAWEMDDEYPRKH
jgi:putative transposase